MALTKFQREICLLIADQRRRSGESYVAGGVALNLITHAGRISRDIDLFHDTVAAVAANWRADRDLLHQVGYEVTAVHEREGFVEAIVCQKNESVIMQWAADSAFRFFPLLEHEELGLTLHPFDLATNKTLALVGRLEARDWVDLISCHRQIQRLGYLAWAASGKDPGFSPAAILELAGRSSRYSELELRSLIFSGSPPSATELARKWHAALAEAKEVIDLLPEGEMGTCVVDMSGQLFNGGPMELDRALKDNLVQFHRGTIHGAYPQLRFRRQ